jgi:hypothetical protein
MNTEKSKKLGQQVTNSSNGLTKREHIAAMAMQGLLSNENLLQNLQHQTYETGRITQMSIEFADALLVKLSFPAI